MFATAIIVFREILEAALIIGIVAAATQGVLRRGAWITSGVLAGVLGAVAVAGVADVLVELADGMGQELFNAFVLLAAVAMLAWHNIWMASHSRELVAQMKQVGGAVSQGGEPPYALLLVVAFAVLREGSEIVLFLHGQAAQGVGHMAMLAGGAGGLLAGIVVGGAMYAGLLRIPTRHFFAVTGWMILLLAAGMASQAAKFLVQADWLPAWGGRIWDISALVSNASPLGSVLHTLIGYDAAPMGMQIAVYLLTLTSIGVAMKIVKIRDQRSLSATAIVARQGVALLVLVGTVWLAGSSAPAQAGPASKVYTPNVEQGETELEFLGGTYVDQRDDVDGESAAKLAIGHGMTSWWFSEVEFKWEKEPSQSEHYTELEWVNVFQLTEPGQYWADLGWFAEFVFPDDGDEAKVLETGPMFQKEIGATVNNLNLIWVRDFGSKADHETEFEYTWQTRVKGDPLLEWGVQGMGEIGNWSNPAAPHDQEHKLGPAIFGTLKTGTNKFKYDAAVLAGVTDDTADYTLRFQLEYEMY